MCTTHRDLGLPGFANGNVYIHGMYRISTGTAAREGRKNATFQIKHLLRASRRAWMEPTATQCNVSHFKAGTKHDSLEQSVSRRRVAFFPADIFPSCMPWLHLTLRCKRCIACRGGADTWQVLPVTLFCSLAMCSSFAVSTLPGFSQDEHVKRHH